jgi:ABC-2 type transport system ATP-binding protein
LSDSPEHDATNQPAADPGAVLRVAGARRHYGDRPALQGVDLSLRSGEIYALLGPNGAGKTTLVRAISGRLRLEDGQVTVCGRDPRADARARRCLGLVPQEIALYPELTARENLTVFGGLMGLGRGRSHAAALRLLRRIDLADRADEPVSRLSGGMKRRLNVAAGVVHDPRVLLLDEPTVGVDPAARESIHDLLRDLRRDGLAMILTTHDLEQATELADRVGVLIDGRIRAEGTVAGLVREVFGDRRELIVTVGRAPAARGRAALVAAGLDATGDARIWTGTLDRGRDDLARLTGDLEAAGIAPEEVTVREPGLRGVYFNLAGREIDA